MYIMLNMYASEFFTVAIYKVEGVEQEGYLLSVYVL